MKTLVCLFAVVLLVALPARGAVLVEDGQPRAAIVVEANAEQAMVAATEIQTYIRKMSGVELLVITEGQPVTAAVRLLVGHTIAAGQLGVEIPAGFDPSIRPDTFEEEGFVVITRGDDIVIGGNQDGPYSGTLYAAYRLLNELGVRWYFPGEWGEVVPERKTVSISELDIREHPDFAQRSVNAGGWCPVSKEEGVAYKKWQLRIGMTVERFYPTAGDGFLASLVDPKEYFEKHPEWYAMNEAGKREAHMHKAGWYYDRYTMLCLSNQEMYAESVSNVKKALAGEKKLSNMSTYGFGISPPDGVPYCYCDECKLASQNFQYPRYAHRTFQSEEFFGFAAKIAREFPNTFVGTMAYSLREIVPQGIDLPKNVSVMVAPISCDVAHPNDSQLWRRRDFIRNLRRWRTLSDHITIYDYNPGFLLGSWIPERDAENFAINAPIYREIGIKGFNAEGRKAFMQTWISNYVRARFLWDADTDLDALKTDFYNTFFGSEAGPHVRAWWDACAEALVNDNIQAHEDWLISHIYTEGFAHSIMKHIDAAKAAEATPQQKARVDAVALIADHLLAFGQMNDAERNLDYARAAEVAGRMYQREVELHDIYSFFHEYYPKGHLRPYFPAGRQKTFEDLAAKSGGVKGDLVAPVPMQSAFLRDPFNEGVIGGWYETAYDDANWETRDTYLTWDQQEKPLDDAGHDYDGYGWYRFSFDVPANLKGRQIHFYCGGVINEGWTWVNGQYAGHQKHYLWWNSPKHSFDYDITEHVEFGKKNTIAIRVLNNAEIGGLYRRGFVYASKDSGE